MAVMLYSFSGCDFLSISTTISAWTMASFERRVPIFITFEEGVVVVVEVVVTPAGCVDTIMKVLSGAVEDEAGGCDEG